MRARQRPRCNPNYNSWTGHGAGDSWAFPPHSAKPPSKPLQVTAARHAGLPCRVSRVGRATEWLSLRERCITGCVRWT
jgi:hypothetical protein